MTGFEHDKGPATTGRRIGYARVSTEDQTLALQLDALNAAGCDRVFCDEGVSGIAAERQALAETLVALKPNDVLVTWRLDRLGRSLSDLINIIEGLSERRVGFCSLTETIDTTSPGGRLIFHIMGALAEFERSLISERTKAGMAAARRRGVKLGRPHKLTVSQIIEAAVKIESGEEDLFSAADSLGVSPPTLARGFQRVDLMDCYRR